MKRDGVHKLPVVSGSGIQGGDEGNGEWVGIMPNADRLALDTRPSMFRYPIQCGYVNLCQDALHNLGGLANTSMGAFTTTLPPPFDMSTRHHFRHHMDHQQHPKRLAGARRLEPHFFTHDFL
jgi:hypothetical protein